MYAERANITLNIFRMLSTLLLEYINDNMLLLEKNKRYYVHCAGGYRSVIFISIMRTRGYHHLVNIRGGLKALKESGCFPLRDYLSTSSAS